MNNYWSDAVEKLIVNSRRLLIFAGETDSPMAIERVIMSAPRSDTELAQEGLTERSFCMKCLTKAQDGLPGKFNPLLEEIAEYFIDELPKYSEPARHGLEKAVPVLRGLRLEIAIQHESAALLVAA